ncbi:ferric-dicitrate binding protein FerR (iron transport regulator) [Flavobacterium sp. 28A]|uniref:FecR family protein n=1 Tax=Flavobacterium sp. 28A TaxID=2735895 RepID=UPI00156FC4C7|nr:FecR family protein [Flavobacterium sp. 28A]NRT16523.1 ferric-dicitrate binding protein FerR (iron transport regulator) [Flavobacterium sp. 28A]
MQRRNQYTEIEDFLADASFLSWVRSNVDRDHWEEWTLEDAKRAKLVETARLWVLAMKVPENSFSTATVQSALVATWNKIEKKEDAISNKPVVKLWNRNWLRSIAAVLVFGLLATWTYSHLFISNDTTQIYNELIDENNEGLVEQTNNSDKPQIITLSDGSSVLLQPKSKLSYPKTFTGTERRVYLSGEGFFEISKNPQKPFLVYANEIVTRVIGTSFKVTAYANKPNIEVLVRTGKVKIESNKAIMNNDKNEDITLLPNEAIRFTRQDLKFKKITDITKDEVLINSLSNIEQLSFDFTDIPVSQIFKTIEQAYLVNIDYPKEKLKNCHLTTSLNDQPLPEKLKIICKALGNNTNYEMNGNQIIIDSDGCN